MKNVIEKLKTYTKECRLETRFEPTFTPSASIFTQQEITQLHRTRGIYEKQIELKEILHQKYNENDQRYDVDFWVINHWGGISSFKRNKVNQNKLDQFKKQLKQRKLTKHTFSTISSLSKVASFIDPSEFVIYDSRVIYALNWLILTQENQCGFQQKYFPMPNGRNKKISHLNMNTILHIFYINDYDRDPDMSEKYINHRDCYFEYCDFIKSAAKQVYGSEAKPYQLEMLLFTIADNEIFHEIKQTLKITTST